MDVKEYISSGILESYVLGAASDQEQQAVQCLSKIYPEISQALRALEEDMESFAQEMAQEPPAHLKANILAAIKNVEQESALQVAVHVPSDNTRVHQETPMTVTKTKRPWLAAASLAALIGLTAIFFVNQNNQKEEIVALQNQLEAVEKQSADLNSLLAQSATQKIELKGTDNEPDAYVSVFWNNETQDVAFTVNNLPELPSDKDYQLWAIVDGKPTDMGVMDYEQAVASIVIGDKKVANAQAFAITIEPKGGSEGPTLSNMVVIGNT